MPEFVKPGVQVLPISAAVDLEIEFDVVSRTSESETTYREVGAAQDGMLCTIVGDVVHLAMQEARFPHRADGDFVLNPLGTSLCSLFLLEAVRQLKALILDLECLLVCPIWIQGRKETWLAEEEAEALDILKLFLKRGKRIDCKVGRDGRELTSALEFLLEECTNRTARVVVTDTGRQRSKIHLFHEALPGSYKKPMPETSASVTRVSTAGVDWVSLVVRILYKPGGGIKKKVASPRFVLAERVPIAVSDEILG